MTLLDIQLIDALCDAKDLRPIFEHKLKRVAGDKKNKLLVDIKSAESILEKVARKNISPEAMGDVLRAAILVHHTQPIEKVVRRIKKAFTVIKIEYKDGSGENPYKGAYHIDVLILNMRCEIQVMPRTMWVYKETAHESYKAGNPGSSRDLFARALLLRAIKQKSYKTKKYKWSNYEK